MIFSCINLYRNKNTSSAYKPRPASRKAVTPGFGKKMMTEDHLAVVGVEEEEAEGLDFIKALTLYFEKRIIERKRK